jgi:hypothetical protein
MDSSISDDIQKLQRLFLFINRETQLTLKIKNILNQSLSQYQSLPLYQVLFGGKEYDEKFLKIGKTLFLLSYLSAHRNILLSLAKMKLQKIEERVNKVKSTCEHESNFDSSIEEKLKIARNFILHNLLSKNESLPGFEKAFLRNKQENQDINNFKIDQAFLNSNLFKNNPINDRSVLNGNKEVDEDRTSYSITDIQKLITGADNQTLENIQNFLLLQSPELLKKNYDFKPEILIQNCNFKPEILMQTEIFKNFKGLFRFQKENEIKKENESLNSFKSTAIEENEVNQSKIGFKRRRLPVDDKLRKKVCVKELIESLEI